MSHTVKSWVQYWIEHYDRPNVRPTTLAAHRYLMENHIIPGLGEVPLAELTEKKVEAFLEEVRLHGNHRPETKCYPLMSEATMRHIWQLLRRCLRQAVQDGLMEANPADKFHYTIGKDITAQPLTALEVEDYMDAAERLGYLAMFALALTSGLREGELIALRWSDLDPNKGELTVWEERKVLYGKLAKYGDRKRLIPLPRKTVELLVMEHEKHPSSPWMFPHPGTCKPYSPTMIRRLHGIILETAGLDHIRLEDLRHTFAVNSLQAGTKPKALSAMLGHNRPDVIARKYRPHLRKEAVVEPTRAVCEASLEELQKAAVEMEFMIPAPLT